MLYTKEPSRTWYVHTNKLPELIKCSHVDCSIIYLSNINDNLHICITKEEKEQTICYLSIMDANDIKLTYEISEKDFNDSLKLVGNKCLKKRVYNVEVINNGFLNINILQDFNKITAQYYNMNPIELNMLTKDWFADEILDNSMSDIELFYKLK
jgi:hypothetical protein